MGGKRDEGAIDQLPSGRYRVRYRVDGKRRGLGTFRDEETAKKALRRVQVEIDDGTWWDETKGEVLFDTFADEYMQYRKAELSPGTFRNYESLLKKHLRPAFGQRQVGSISVRDVDLWWATMADHPVTRRNGYFLLSNMFRLALSWEHTKQTPCVRPKAGKDVATPRPTFAVSDFRAVLNLMPENMQLPVLVLYNGSLRLGELCGLRRSDFDSTTGMLRVERQRSAVTGQIAKTKTGQRKDVPLFGEARVRLTEYIKDHPALPLAGLWQPLGGLTAQRLRRAWISACEGAQIENFHLHDLRHISLTEWARLPDVNLKDIQARGGHASINAALRYQHTDQARALELARLAEAAS